MLEHVLVHAFVHAFVHVLLHLLALVLVDVLVGGLQTHTPYFPEYILQLKILHFCWRAFSNRSGAISHRDRSLLTCSFFIGEHTPNEKDCFLLI